MPKERAKATRPTASSRATTGSKMSVSFPFALYCFTTIRVAAGAVAVAIAPRVIAAGRLRVLPPVISTTMTKTMSTTIIAVTA